MSKSNKWVYCSPMVSVFELCPDSQILSYSNWAGVFLLESLNSESSSGAGEFIPEE